MKRGDWLDPVLFRAPIKLALCVSQEQFDREMKLMGVPPENRKTWLRPHVAAAVHYFESPDEGTACVVCIRPNPKDLPSILEYLVHESVHVWQEIKSVIGEREPSKEFDAYAVQAIWRLLFDSYAKQTKPRRKKPKK